MGKAIDRNVDRRTVESTVQIEANAQDRPEREQKQNTTGRVNGRRNSPFEVVGNNNNKTKG